MQPSATAGLHDALANAFRQLSTTFAKRLEGDGTALRRPDYHLLTEVERHCSLRPSELAERHGLDVSTLSRRIAGLVDRGLLERTPDDSDRRAFRVALTDEGRERLHAERSARAQIITALLADWPNEDIDTLATLLDRLSADAAAARLESTERTVA